jgi:hypothetical protein
MLFWLSAANDLRTIPFDFDCSVYNKAKESEKIRHIIQLKKSVVNSLVRRQPFNNFFYIIFLSNYDDLISCFQSCIAIRDNHFLLPFDGGY